MPNYKYECVGCSYEELMFLKMSEDPKKTFSCPRCEGEMTRRITKSSVKFERDTLGKWFKEQTGKELLGD